jgi:transcriptional regulator of acetoin/glycerol metabolism
VVKRATLMAPAAELTPDQLPGHLLAALSQERAAAVPLQITNELDLIRQAVERAGGNVTKAARMLGISRTTIYRKLSTAELRID